MMQVDTSRNTSPAARVERGHDRLCLMANGPDLDTPTMQQDTAQSSKNIRLENSHDGQSGCVPSVEPHADVRPLKACEACRTLKIGCILDRSSSLGFCRRCVKRGQKCVRHPVGPRRKKRADTRLTDLEEKVEAFFHALHPPKLHGPAIEAGPKSLYQETSVDQSLVALSVRDGVAGLRVLDLITLGILEAETAYQLFDFYKKEMSGMMPFVVFGDGQAEAVRRERPLLFLSILAVAAGVLKPGLHHYLTDEVWKILADRVLYTGKPLLEVIQALQLTAVYYTQHGRREDHRNYHHLMHSAAVMAMDAGMGKRVKPNPSRIFNDPWEHGFAREAPNSVEIRRTWLGIYFLCSTVATTLRKPHLLRWNPYTEESLAILSTSKDALPTDVWLCHMVRAEHIVEDVHFQFSMDDPMTSISPTDRSTEIYIKLFEKRIQDWRVAATPDMPQALVELTDAHATLYIHEVAMHHDHDVDDFKPPFSMVSDDPNPQRPCVIITPDHISSLTICVHSIHRIFDAFLSLDPIRLRTFPCIVFVRILYAGIALLKMSSIVAANSTSLYPLLSSEGLRTEQYLDALVATLALTSDHGKYRATGEFWEQVSMMKHWWLKVEHLKDLSQGCSSSAPILATLGETFGAAKPSYGETVTVITGDPHRDTGVPTVVPLNSPTQIGASSATDHEQAVTLNSSPNFHDQPDLHDSTFEFDADIPLNAFDMLGEFDNGMTSFWPYWTVKGWS